MATIKRLSWYDRLSAHNNEPYIDPDSTRVKGMKKPGIAYLDAHADHLAATRERDAASADVFASKDRARAAAIEAGKKGGKLDKVAAKAARGAVADRLEDAEADFDSSSARMLEARATYAAALSLHAPALLAEAQAEADTAVLSLANSATTLRRTGQTLLDALTLVQALPATVTGAPLNATPPSARREPGDDANVAPYPAPLVGLAVQNVGLAIGYSQRILDDAKVAGRAATDARPAAAAEAVATADEGDPLEPGDVPYTDEDDD